MFRERLKSSVILILIVNMLFLTSEIWFVHSYSTVGEKLVNYVRSNTLVQKLFPADREYSIPKENLSLPRKFLINDGSLWMVYYNTDIGFSPIEERTRSIINGFLQGDITAVRKVDNETWEAGLESLSIYVEYPIAFSREIFCRIMGVDEELAPSEIEYIHDFVIIPSSASSDICLLVRDYEEKENIYAYILSSKYQFPASDLNVYTTGEDYYEPAFSTGLFIESESNVSLSPLVLFSDSRPTTAVITPVSLINTHSEKQLLENFSFNSNGSNNYKSDDGVLTYIENYGSIKIYPDSLFEYKAVSGDRGIELKNSATAYDALNSAIDFAEKTWGSISREPLNILVTSNLSDFNYDEAYTFKFNYYYNGRPVEIDLGKRYGHDDMNCAVEVTLKSGRIITYRQYMVSYHTDYSHQIEDNFLTALDNFVHTIGTSSNEPIVIRDIYIGYLDSGNMQELSARWLATTVDSSKIYYYTPETKEVTED
ncbi:MAG: hypothetical protein UIL37_05700 [Clostridia bacterium]|nr:hypothetical protein [Clostridia bacterium]